MCLQIICICICVFVSSDVYFYLYVCVQVTAEVPMLLQGPHDAGHHCHLLLNPNNDNDPRTFRLRTVSNTWSIHDYFIPRVEAYGLHGYARLTSSEDQLRSDPSLLTSLVDRWRPETHTFHFRFGELAPT